MSAAQRFGERQSQTTTLEDGRTLGYAEVGVEDGYPIFHQHGLPGSRYECNLFGPAAIEHNARIITIDRPGIGISSPQPGRTAVDHAKGIQALAKRLNISTFIVMGVSGGGPYGLACAYAIPPSQLKRVAIVAGWGMYKEDTAKEIMTANRWMFWAFKAVPWGADLYARCIFIPMLRKSDEQMHAEMKEGLKAMGPDSKDKAAFGDKRGEEMHWALLAEIREHFKQGYWNYTVEGKMIGEDLGFDLADVQSETVALWYGKQDVNVPAAIGEDYARGLKGKAMLRIEDETHIRYVLEQNGE